MLLLPLFLLLAVPARATELSDALELPALQAAAPEGAAAAEVLAAHEYVGEGDDRDE